MSKIILHIGTHKTGTTSLQRLCAGASDALAERGVLYPRSARPRYGPTAGHHLIGWSIIGKRGVQPRDVWPALLRELNDSDLPRVLLSAEGMENLDRQQILHLRERLPGDDFRVVVYLRHPRDFLISVYRQRIKQGTERGSFADFIERKGYRADYARLLSDWANAFGREAIVPRLYDKVVRQPGLVTDFLGLLSLDAAGLPAGTAGNKRYNRTPSDPMLGFFHRLNRSPVLQRSGPVGETAGRALRFLLTRLDRLDGGRCGALLGRACPPLIDAAELDMAGDLCRPWIEHLFDDWLAAEDRKYVAW